MSKLERKIGNIVGAVILENTRNAETKQRRGAFVPWIGKNDLTKVPFSKKLEVIKGWKNL
jgi:hypothetical protein